MIFSDDFDRSIFLILKNDKKNREKIKELLTSIPNELYEKAQELIKQGKIHEINLKHRINDIIYVLKYNPEYECIDIIMYEGVNTKQKLHIFDSKRCSVGTYTSYSNKKQKYGDRLIYDYEVHNSHIKGLKHKVFFKETFGDYLYKRNHKLFNPSIVPKSLSLKHIKEEF